MSDFSADWLQLREPVDLRSRNAELASRLRAVFATHSHVRVIDLGCGTGANLRATAHLLGPEVGSVQDWVLVDHNPALLARAAIVLAAWADTATTHGNDLKLVKTGITITVKFREADLMRELDDILSAGVDLLTASAFFDLASPEFIRMAAAAAARHKAAFYTVLTYNGAQNSVPIHEDDDQVRHAFNAHQQGDKGFGSAAGGAAPEYLSQAFETLSYNVVAGDSPWHVGENDHNLARQLIDGVAAAALETGRVDAAVISAWQRAPRRGVCVGHTDTLALPPE
jgi:SAM-dependent methyltransferase